MSAHYVRTQCWAPQIQWSRQSVRADSPVIQGCLCCVLDLGRSCAQAALEAGRDSSIKPGELGVKRFKDRWCLGWFLKEFDEKGGKDILGRRKSMAKKGHKNQASSEWAEPSAPIQSTPSPPRWELRCREGNGLKFTQPAEAQWQPEPRLWAPPHPSVCCGQKWKLRWASPLRFVFNTRWQEWPRTLHSDTGIWGSFGSLC